jgi:hypothetical protein
MSKKVKQPIPPNPDHKEDFLAVLMQAVKPVKK